MAKVLCIETATEVCSVCLTELETGEILWEETAVEGFTHAKNITHYIDQCLTSTQTQRKEIKAIALSNGPGSYTGLRIGASVAKGIAYGMEVPIIAIDTLQALAVATKKKYPDSNTVFLPMIDARRMEVYTAPFDYRGERLAETSSIILTETSLFKDYLDKGKKLVVLGNGAEKCRTLEISKQIDFLNILCSSVHIASLVYKAYISRRFENPAYYVPFYMKPPNITKSKKLIL